MNLEEIKAKIDLSLGDITQLEVDVIVNSANTDLILGSGVSGEIGRKGGDVIQEACDAIQSVPLGGAVETPGGALTAAHVIHAASVEVGRFAKEKNVAKATRSALVRADQLKAKTIAFPAVGTGAAGFPVHRCARVMLDVVARHLSGGSKLERVHIVLFDDEMLDTFREAFGKMGEVQRTPSRPKNRRPRGGRGGQGKGDSAKGGSPKGGQSKGGSPKGGQSKGGSPKGRRSRGGQPRGGQPRAGQPKGGQPKGDSPKQG